MKMHSEQPCSPQRYKKERKNKMGIEFYNREKVSCKIGDIICDSVRPEGEEQGGDIGIYVVDRKSVV